MPLFKKSKTLSPEAESPDQGPPISILEIQKAFDPREEQRRSEHLRVLYSMGEDTGEVRAAITWEALARIRQEMERAGKTISERGVLDFVLLPWIIEKLRQSHQSMERPPEEGYLLDFGSAPKPHEVRETLIRFGLLTA
jgi:hypothetical protein